MTAAQLAALDADHRARQARNATIVAAAVLYYWQRVDPADISGSGRSWLESSIAVITRGQESAAKISAANALAVRKIQVPSAPPLVVPPIPLVNVEQVTKSLSYMGLGGAAIRIDKAVRAPAARARQEAAQPPQQGEGAPPSLGQDQRVVQAMRIAGGQAAGAAVRHVQNGGRAMIDEIVKVDSIATGTVRVTRGDCCWFCSMLASRGPVYRTDSFDKSDPRFEGPGDHKVHDSCGCALRTVYLTNEDEWPTDALRFRDLWDQAKVRAKDTGEYVQEAYRRLYESSLNTAA